MIKVKKSERFRVELGYSYSCSSKKIWPLDAKLHRIAGRLSTDSGTMVGACPVQRDLTFRFATRARADKFVRDAKKLKSVRARIFDDMRPNPGKKKLRTRF